jgi:uncharacterized membrane protein YoaT (DUF817 family)
MNRIISQIFTGLIAIISLVSVALFWKYNLMLTIILIVLAMLMLLINKSKQEIKTFIFCAFFGTIAESFAIIFGAWNYGNPNLVNIPIWLIVLWGIASVFIIRVYLFFKN